MGNISYLLKSLYSNQVILEGRKKPWYFTLLFFVLGIFLPWIPNLSNGYTSDSSTFISSSQNFEIDKGLLMLAKEASFNQATIGKNGEEYFLDMSGFSDPDFQAKYVDTTSTSYRNEYDGDNVSKELALGYYCDSSTTVGDAEGQVFHANEYVTVTNKTETNLSQAFYFDALLLDRDEYPTITPAPSTSSSSTGSDQPQYEDNGKTYFLLAYYFPGLDTREGKNGQLLVNFIYSVILNAKTDGTGVQNYPHSYIIFTEDSFSLVTYPLQSTLTSGYGVSYMYGSFNDAVSEQEPSVGTGLQSFLGRDNASDEQLLTNIKVFFNAGHRANTIRTTWINCGILSAVYAGLVLVSSAIVIFLVKRKSSVYRETNYWEALKISVTLAFTPAVIAMAVGFMSFEYGIGGLVLCVLFRVIWMNGKICPPTKTDDKPLYQARQ